MPWRPPGDVLSSAQLEQSDHSLATHQRWDKRWKLAPGTLGGSNHFIELAADLDTIVWITCIGSREETATRSARTTSHYIKVAQQLCKTMRIRLPDRDLAYLPEKHPAFAE